MSKKLGRAILQAMQIEKMQMNELWQWYLETEYNFLDRKANTVSIHTCMQKWITKIDTREL